jgi:cbb3-type cytochrome oxidase cytochrome c subunit
MATSRWRSFVVAAALTQALPATLAAQEAAAGLTPDPALAQKGKGLWNSRGCTGCHSIGGGKRSGPDLAGVLERRELGWLRRWLKNPTQMLETDSLAQAMLAQYNNTKMPNMRLSDADIESLLQFIAAESEKHRQQAGSQ